MHPGTGRKWFSNDAEHGEFLMRLAALPCIILIVIVFHCFAHDRIYTLQFSDDSPLWEVGVRPQNHYVPQMKLETYHKMVALQKQYPDTLGRVHLYHLTLNDLLKQWNTAKQGMSGWNL